MPVLLWARMHAQSLSRDSGCLRPPLLDPRNLFARTARMLDEDLRGWAQVEGAHALGVLAVSWAPAVPRGSLTSGKAPGPPVRRFVSGGCDNLVKVCTFLTQETLSATFQSNNHN